MSSLSLLYPVSPHVVTRAWGVADELYKEFGFLKHNGIDLALSEGQEIRAPFDCAVSLVGNQPKGSGLFVCLLSTAAYDFPDGVRARVELSFMHLSRTPVSKGMRLGAGAVFAYGGHTGRATGPHVHIAPKRVKKGVIGYRDLDRNDANNTFDPDPYWIQDYARTNS
ncbi:M23 family metallopeptidase [Patescibacteria group bacterium]|nr:M23 family metallopeptidase [Patescibacteria group bacterium]